MYIYRRVYTYTPARGEQPPGRSPRPACHLPRPARHLPTARCLPQRRRPWPCPAGSPAPRLGHRHLREPPGRFPRLRASHPRREPSSSGRLSGTLRQEAAIPSPAALAGCEAPSPGDAALARLQVPACRSTGRCLPAPAPWAPTAAPLYSSQRKPHFAPLGLPSPRLPSGPFQSSIRRPSEGPIRGKREGLAERGEAKSATKLSLEAGLAGE